MNVFSSKPFPIDDASFPSIKLSDRHLTRLRTEAAAAVREAIAECNTYQQQRGTYLVDCPPWRPLADHDGLNAYTRDHKSRPSIKSTRIFGTVEGNYRDLAGFFKSDTRAEYVAAQTLLSKHTVDANVLRVVSSSRRRASITSESIKWAAFDPFALRHRLDSCHFESMGVGIDATGRPYAFRALIPAVFPEFPDFYKSKKTVRVYHKSVMILTPSDRDAATSCELFMAMQNDFNGVRVPRRLYKKYLVSLKKLLSFVDIQRIAVAQRAQAADHRRSQCAVCSRAFSFMRAKHYCSVCSDAVCRKCTVKGSDVLQTKCSSRFCSPCIQRFRQPQEEEEDEAESAATPILEHEETSYDDFLASYVRVGRKSSVAGWVSSPPEKSPMKRARLGTDTTWVTESFSGVHSQLSSPGGSSCRLSSSLAVSVVGQGVNQIEYIDDERSSFRSVELMVDTREMTRLPGNTAFYPATRPTSSTSSQLMQSIHSALYEQELMLRQLRVSVRQHTPDESHLRMSDL